MIIYSTTTLPEILDQLESLWPELAAALRERWVDQEREQYEWDDANARIEELEGQLEEREARVEELEILRTKLAKLLKDAE